MPGTETRVYIYMYIHAYSSLYHYLPPRSDTFSPQSYVVLEKSVGTWNGSFFVQVFRVQLYYVYIAGRESERSRGELRECVRCCSITKDERAVLLNSTRLRVMCYARPIARERFSEEEEARIARCTVVEIFDDAVVNNDLEKHEIFGERISRRCF